MTDFVCPACGAVFSKGKPLRVHVIQKHGAILDRKNNLIPDTHENYATVDMKAKRKAIKGSTNLGRPYQAGAPGSGKRG